MVETRDFYSPISMMNTLQFYQELDLHPFTGTRQVNFKAMVAQNDITMPFFNRTPGYVQVKNVTPGRVYQITSVEGFGDVADLHFLDDTGKDHSLGSFFFVEPPKN